MSNESDWEKFPFDDEDEATSGFVSIPASIIDPILDVTDPTPNIHQLFVDYSRTYFWNQLGCVDVSWSKRMFVCAGICQYSPRGGMCSIRLSEPLLKFRPRKDLVETLLHEMIHAFLFVTQRDRDRDGHGPNFQQHMRRINEAAGTRITIYHSFHDEVRNYKQHWWQCTGPCRNRPPFYGLVKRTMNRAPGPSDFWHAEHKRHCNGTFVKIKEPEKPPQKNAEKSVEPKRKCGKNAANSNSSGSTSSTKKSSNNTNAIKSKDIRTLFADNATSNPPHEKDNFHAISTSTLLSSSSSSSFSSHSSVISSKPVKSEVFIPQITSPSKQASRSPSKLSFDAAGFAGHTLGGSKQMLANSPPNCKRSRLLDLFK